jgi:hypothetical protein
MTLALPPAMGLTEHMTLLNKAGLDVSSVVRLAFGVPRTHALWP